jgi:hypothetical protein
LWLHATVAFVFCAVRVAERGLQNDAPAMSVDTILEGLDGIFRTVYGGERGRRASEQLILTVLGDELLLCRGADVRRWCITSRAITALRVVCHAPVTLFVHARNGARAQPERVGEATDLVSFQRNLEDAVRRSSDEVADEARRPLRELLERCAELVRALRSGEPPATAQVDAFARAAGPLLLPLIAEATRQQLALLRAASDAAFAELEAQEREAVIVVVAGAHQARARSLPMQFFRQELGETQGPERRVLYAESATSLEQVRTLVGTLLLDRELAIGFFGDPTRLQRDVLGDAAAAQLAKPRR